MQGRGHRGMKMNHIVRERHFRQAILIAALLMLIALPVQAQDDDDPLEAAQMFLSGEYLRYRPNVPRTDLLFFARMAGLSAQQREAALDLYSAYSTRHEAAARKMQEYEDALTSGDHQRIWNDPKIEPVLRPVRDDFHKHQQKLKEELLADMKALLTDDQQGKWEWFERRLNWDASSWQLAIIGGQQPDLALIAHRVAGDQPFSQEVIDVLTRYYADSFALMKDTADAVVRHRLETRHIEDDQERQAEEQAFRQEFLQRNLALMQRTASKLQSLLPEPLGERFEEAYLRGLTLNLDTTSYMVRPDRAYAAARSVKNLSEDQRARIEAIESEDRKDDIVRMRALLEERLKRPLGWQGDQADANQMDAMLRYQQRITRHKALISRLREILTPEQQEEAGPPISAIDVRLPNFEDENEPAPPMKPSRPGIPDMEAAFDRPVMSDLDLAFLKREASLTDEQYASAKDLLDAYRARNRLASRKMAAYQQAVSERMMQGDTGEMLDKRSMRFYLQYHRYNERIRDELVEDLRSLLTEEQSPAFEAIRRRIKRRSLSSDGISFGIAGVNADLTAITEGIFAGESPPEDIRAVLSRYEADLAPIVGRLTAFQRVQMRRFEKMAEGGGALNITDMMGQFESMQKDARKMMVEARELNLKCFRELAPKFPDDRRAEFEEAYYSAALGANMWAMMDQNPRRPRDLLAEARALGDLTPEQDASLAAAARRFASETAASLREAFEAQIKNERPDQSMMERAQAMSRSDLNQRVEAMRDSREKAVDSMLASLTEEQRQRLPKPYRTGGPVERPRFEEE